MPTISVEIMKIIHERERCDKMCVVMRGSNSKGHKDIDNYCQRKWK